MSGGNEAFSTITINKWGRVRDARNTESTLGLDVVAEARGYLLKSGEPSSAGSFRLRRIGAQSNLNLKGPSGSACVPVTSGRYTSAPALRPRSAESKASGD